MVLISPKNIIVDFLRANLTDPRSRAETSQIEEFDGGSTDFTLTPVSGSLSAVTTVTVNGTAQVKWKDFYIDFQNEKVIFFSNTASGTNNVDITYKRGSTNWIYPDKPLTTLSPSAFPRISVSDISGSGERLGAVGSDMQSTTLFQIDVWVAEDFIATISGTNYEGDKLGEILGLLIMEQFRSNADELHPPLFNISYGASIQDLPFNEELQLHHKILQIEANSINFGEIT